MEILEEIIPYDMTTYNFQDIFCRIFESRNLDIIHTRFNTIERLTFDNDTKTLFHNKYYTSEFYNELIELYIKFITDIIAPRFKDTKFAIQTDPAFRIHLPNNTAIGARIFDENEYIGIHCDADYNHQPGEINFILPITNMFETNSVYTESHPMRGDFHPVNIKQGNIFMFYGNKCRHYNKLNNTNKTRISLDFRIIPLSRYDDTWDKLSVHGNRNMKLGGYFNMLTI
jgi:hypothetical protein